ncbi:MAG TPA: hypothetical protein VG866_00110 [Candidatus Paceibacterota bacterium]|nr:hypothetical protein [Candidatus Paceibacterota bacterium]
MTLLSDPWRYRNHKAALLIQKTILDLCKERGWVYQTLELNQLQLHNLLTNFILKEYSHFEYPGLEGSGSFFAGCSIVHPLEKDYPWENYAHFGFYPIHGAETDYPRSFTNSIDLEDLMQRIEKSLNTSEIAEHIKKLLEIAMRTEEEIMKRRFQITQTP